MQVEKQVHELDALSRFDHEIERVKQWSTQDSQWSDQVQAQEFLRHAMKRVEELRRRDQIPLIAATFGGTGSGKSTLVNALVGQDVTVAGRQRPTTRKPLLLISPEVDPLDLEIPLETLEIKQCPAPLLNDVALIDCPDPDTNEAAEEGSNLAQLRGIVPYCDVLIFVTTQQKYRSNRILDELAQAAVGCRLIFVQTHADLDSDIRDDWRSQLSRGYRLNEIFFVDSLKAIREQEAGEPVSGDFAKLQGFLTTGFTSHRRQMIRQANAIDLLHGSVTHALQLMSGTHPDVENVRETLVNQHHRVMEKMTNQLTEELLESRGLWERRLLAAVNETWGATAFSSVLKLYSGLGGLMASFGLMRARTTAQMALIGTMQGLKWLGTKRETQEAESKLKEISRFGLDEATLSEIKLLLAGYVRTAGLSAELVEGQSITHLKSAAAKVEEDFLVDASARIDKIISELARKNSGWIRRTVFEVLFVSYLAFVLYRVGYNFFYESFWLNKEILKMDFYIPAGIFLVLWTGLLVILFIRGLRQGLNERINGMARELVQHQLADGLFPDLERAVGDALQANAELVEAEQHLSSLQRDLEAITHVGSIRIEAGAS